jgi:ribokinase
MRTAVLGHVEWVDFLRVERLPHAGAIVAASEAWEEPAGGGGVAAVQLAKLSGSCTLFTALGNDERARRSRQQLSELGVHVEAASRAEPQRRAVTFVEASGERTITTAGPRIAAVGSDSLPWATVEQIDALYVCAADAAAVRLARRARVVVATSRILPVLREAAVVIDALVGSANDPSERYERGDLQPPPKLVVRTNGGKGGEYWTSGGSVARYAPAPLPGPVVDAYGAGDSFAAGLAYALADGQKPDEAIAFAARCGAAALTGRGAFAGQMRLP